MEAEKQVALRRALEALEQEGTLDRPSEEPMGTGVQRSYIQLTVCTEAQPDLPFNRLEFSLRPGLPIIELSGLPSGRSKGLILRVVAALKSAGFRLARRRISISLQRAPGPGDLDLLDLPLALGLLHLSGALVLPSGLLVAGRVHLDGSLVTGPEILALLLRNRRWRLPMLLGLGAAEQVHYPRELRSLNHLKEIRGLRDLGTLGHFATEDFYMREDLAERLLRLDGALAASSQEADFAGTAGRGRGLGSLRREAERGLLELPRQSLGFLAVRAAALGGHHLLMVGSPGCGKSSLAELLERLVPPAGAERLLERWELHCLAGRSLAAARTGQGPCIYPNSSPAQLLGRRGGLGLLSLAHGGLLRCEEVPQFSRRLLFLLQEAMDEGRVTASAGSGTWPSRFQLVALANPCSCGRYYEQQPACSCPLGSPSIWTRRIPSSFLDRLDLRLILRSPQTEDFGQLGAAATRCVDLESLRSDLERIRLWQAETWFPAEARRAGQTTADLARTGEQRSFSLSPEALQLAESEAQQRGLSLRSYRLLLGVARSLADLDCKRVVGLTQMACALQFVPGREGRVTGCGQ